MTLTACGGLICLSLTWRIMREGDGTVGGMHHGKGFYVMQHLKW